MEEEVSLYDLFEVLSRRKKLMWGIFLLVVVLGVLYAGYVRSSSKDYEAVATIIVNPIDINKSLQTKVNAEDQFENLVNATLPYPSFTNETYLSLITSRMVIEKLLTDMDLSEEYTVDNFRKKLQAENIEKTSLIKLKVKDKEPQRAAEIANSWVIVFTNAIDESIQNHLEKMLKTISSRVESDEKDYIRISQEIESFQEKNLNQEGIQKEIVKLTEQYLDYQKTLVDLDFTIKTQETEIQKTKEYLEKETQLIELQKSVLSEPIYLGYLLSTENQIDPKPFSIMSQELNQNYFTLSEKLATLEVSLAGNKKRKEDLLSSGIIEDLQHQILEKQALIVKTDRNLALLDRQREVFYNNYRASFKKLDEIKTVSSAWVGETNVTLLSEAIPPSEPTVGTSAKLILAVAVVAGLFLAIFMAFLVEFLDKMKQYKKA
jgi:succinoglycan biosynthesis transport protein ExoP